MNTPKKHFDVNVTRSEWERAEELTRKALASLAKVGLVDSSEYDSDEYDRYRANEEINKFISSRLPWID